jgi:hypothetical protein
MTVRTLNYTKRRRIRREHVDISLFTTTLGEYAFDAVVDLETYRLPEEARIFIEAYRQTHWMRFDFGTVGKLVPPKNRSLAIFDNTDGVLFRVRVTATTERVGLLLAEADRLPFRTKDDKQKKRIPLLPVVPQNLKDEICKVSFETRGPELLVNSAIGNWRGIARDPVVIAMVYPFVLREILSRISFMEDQFDLEDQSDWRTRWCRFAETLPGMEPLPEDPNDREDWIDRAVQAFSRRNAVITKFGNYWKEDGGE